MAEALPGSPWPGFSRLTWIVLSACAVAGGLHLIWMPQVAYDPLAPFRVFWMTLEGSYFPVAALITWLAGRASVQRMPWRGRRLGEMLPHLALALLAALLLAKVMRWQGSLNLVALYLWLFLSIHGAALARRERHALLVEWLLVAVLFAAASYAFTVFKAGLFHVATGHDAALIAAERFLFGDPPLYQRFADFGSRLGDIGLRLTETIYFQFFAHMLLVSVFLGARREGGERRRYVVALIVCYLIGGLAYYLLPGLGPVFHDPSRFAHLDEAVRTTSVIQDLLVHNTAAARNDFAGLERLDVYAFIACMPSLHLAHESVMLYFSRRSPVAFGMSLLFFAASCVAVVVLGWHYAIDIPFGILLGILSLKLADYFVGTAKLRR